MAVVGASRLQHRVITNCGKQASSFIPELSSFVASSASDPKIKREYDRCRLREKEQYGAESP